MLQANTAPETLDRSVLKGIEAFQTQQYAQAWDFLEPVTHVEISSDNRMVYQSRLIAAWSLIHMQRHEEALHILSSLQGFLEETKHLVHLCQGLAYLGLKKPIQAKDHFQAALESFPQSAFKGDMHLGLAQAYENTGDFAKARQHYQEASLTRNSTQVLSQASYQLASLEEKEKRWSDAVKWYRFFLQKTPPDAVLSKQAEEKISFLQKTYMHEEDSFKTHLKHLDTLLAARSLDKAKKMLASLSEVASLSNTQSLQLQQRKALWLDRKGQKEEALFLLQTLVEAKDENIRTESEKMLARLLASLNKPLLSIEMYLSHHNNASYHFKAAHTAYMAGMYEDAAALFWDYYKRYKRVSSRDEALWYAAWCCYKAGLFNETLKFFSLLKKNHPRSALLERVYYWEANIYTKQNKLAQANTLYSSLSLRSTSYYGIWALEKSRGTNTGSCASLKPSDTPSLPWGDNVFIWTSPEAHRFLRLLEMGFQEDAAEAAKKIPVEKKTPQKALFYARARLAYALGDYHHAHTLLTLHAPDKIDTIGDAGSLPYVYMAYPKAFEQTVGKAAKDFSLPAEMVWAVMKQESEFKTKATSQASAHGLMQIIPVTGEHIAQALDHPSFHPAHLSDVFLNIRFGAWYLKQLSNMFHGNLGLAAAAYNAGPFQTASWVEKNPHAPMDEFVEDIPFKETRHYVKRVLSNLYTYRHLYGVCPNRMPTDSGEISTLEKVHF